MEAAQFRERLDIAIVPSMKLDYYKILRSKYNQVIHQEKPQLPEAPPDMSLDAAGPEAKEAIMGVFRSLKRGMGYV